MIIPSDDHYWITIGLTFLDILDIVSSPRISSDSLLDLEVLLKEFVTEFKRLFPNCAVTPKMHYLLLYPHFIKKIGPLVLFSCMRFESKHKQLKELVTRGNNYKNVAYTISMQHQLQLAVRLNQTDLYETSCTFSNTISCNDVDLFQQYDFPCFKNGTDRNLNASEKATIDGITYDMRSVVCYSVNQDCVPEFLLVRFICWNSYDNIWLIGQKLTTECFEEHYCGWKVEILNDLVCVSQTDLIYPHTLSLISPFGSFSLFVRPKFRLERTIV